MSRSGFQLLKPGSRFWKSTLFDPFAGGQVWHLVASKRNCSCIAQTLARCQLWPPARTRTPDSTSRLLIEYMLKTVEEFTEDIGLAKIGMASLDLVGTLFRVHAGVSCGPGACNL